MRVRRRWKPSGLTWSIVVLSLCGIGVGLYPMSASWISAHNQSLIIEKAAANIDSLVPVREEQMKLAHAYNDALVAGVDLEAGGNVPVSAGNLGATELKYEDLLRANDEGLMARVKIPKISVDLPIYHGTDDKTLLRGAGHLEGSHLPVGGVDTRSVITAHRGLANSMMFTDLNKVETGDTFVVEVLGEVLTYRVFDVEVIDPSDTSSLRAVPGEDLVTLITCTPLGINSHRIVVTGERITPTPPGDLLASGENPAVPGFAWWIVLGLGGAVLVGAYCVRQGFVDGRRSTVASKSEIFA